MKHEPQAQPEDAMITLEGEDGKSYSCQLLNIFDFENQEYALLLKPEESKEAKEAKDAKKEEGCLVIMRLIERDDQSIFQTIESDEEFERVVAHVETLAKQAQAEAVPED
jgi:hypothetical protein